jgi:hypothetical protein
MRLPCQAIRRRDNHHIELSPSHMVTQRIEAGPLQSSTATAVVAEDVLFAEHPVRMVAHVGPQETHLLLDCLGLLLPIR